jgi:hypothetical protein
MKKLTFISGLFILSIFLLMTSCKKDTPLDKAIIGKWEVVSITQVNYVDDVKKTAVTYYFGPGEMAYQFAEGGTGIYYENNDVYGMFDWTLNGNTLTISGATDSLDWLVTYNSGSLEWTYSQTEAGDGVTNKYEFFYTTKKID